MILNKYDYNDSYYLHQGGLDFTYARLLDGLSTELHKKKNVLKLIIK